MADDPKHAPATAEEGLDALPMNKTPVGLIVGIVVGVLLIGGTLAFTMGGGKGKSAAASAAAPPVESALTKEQLKEQREFLQMTERAMARAEEAKQAKAAEDEAKKAEAEAAEKPADKAAPSGPAPVQGAAAKKAASDLDSLGDDIVTGLK